MPLTDVAIRQAKPGPKATKLSDEKGMFLLITPAGGKLWRFKYRFEGREKLLALGAYPAVSLRPPAVLDHDWRPAVYANWRFLPLHRMKLPWVSPSFPSCSASGKGRARKESDPL